MMVSNLPVCISTHAVFHLSPPCRTEEGEAWASSWVGIWLLAKVNPRAVVTSLKVWRSCGAWDITFTFVDNCQLSKIGHRKTGVQASFISQTIFSSWRKHHRKVSRKSLTILYINCRKEEQENGIEKEKRRCVQKNMWLSNNTKQLFIFSVLNLRWWSYWMPDCTDR